MKRRYWILIGAAGCLVAALTAFGGDHLWLGGLLTLIGAAAVVFAIVDEEL